MAKKITSILKPFVYPFAIIGVFFTALSLYLYFTPATEDGFDTIFSCMKEGSAIDDNIDDYYVYGLGFIKREHEYNMAHNIKIEYDKNRNMVEVSAFDRKGNRLMEFPDENIGYTRKTYDENGYFTRMEFYDLEGNLMLRNDKHAIVETDWDKDGNILEVKFYGTDSELIENEEGYAIKRNEYDEDGNRAKETFYDANGELVNTKDL